MSVEMKDQIRNPHPRHDDPLEVRIRGLIRDQVYSTPLGREMFRKVDEAQLAYFRDSLAHLGDPDLIHDRTQALLKKIAEMTNAQIVYGKENLAKVPKGSPVFAEVNHFSGYKLTAIEQSDLGLNLPEIDEIFPYTLFYSSLVPVAEILGRKLYMAQLEMPEPLLTVQKTAGLLLVPLEKGSFEVVLQRSKEHVDKYPNSVTVLFPEGGTSGKRNGGGPYDLEPFHSGSFAIAGKLGITVLPITQFFNPNRGFEVAVFEPFKPDPKGGREYFDELANNTRKQMQAWLDTKKSS